MFGERAIWKWGFLRKKKDLKSRLGRQYQTFCNYSLGIENTDMKNFNIIKITGMKSFT